MPSYTDDFNRAAIGANWTMAFNTMAIYNSVEAYPSGSAVECAAFYNATSFGADQWSKATVKAVEANYEAGVCVRASAGGGYYYGYYGTTTYRELYKVVNGVFTSLYNTASLPMAVNDIIEIRAIGYTIIAILNGAIDAVVSDTAIATGSPGVCGYGSSTASRVDNWSGGDLSLNSASYTTAGTYTNRVPLGVTQYEMIELWGGGAPGGNATGFPSYAGGGGGGNFVASGKVAVTPALSYATIVAAAKVAVTNATGSGNDSTFNATTVVAKGGIGGATATGTTSAGGTSVTTSCTGNLKLAGGKGGNGTAATSTGGGGSGAGTGGVGNAGSGATPGGARTVGGGSGATGSTTTNGQIAGTAAGGGGNGAYASAATDRSGGNGAAGRADLYWIDPQCTIFLLGLCV